MTIDSSLRPCGKHSVPNTSFRPDIEGLRAIAVLLVIGAHFAIPGLSAGFIGVDVFFVISGYLITGILVRERENTGRIALTRFYANRLRRLLPALATMLIISSALAFKLLPEAQNVVHSQAAAMAALWVSNIYFAFADVDYFAAETSGNAFLHTWSLGVEEQFYLVWPLLIILALRWAKGSSPKSALTALFAGIAVLSLGASLLASQTSPIIGFYMMPTRAWQFAAGALVWLLSRQRAPSQFQAKALGWSGILLLVMALIVIGPQTSYPGVAALLPTMATCALLWAGVSADGQRTTSPSALFSLAPMQAIGRLSYAWYLWHWPILVIGENLLPIKGNANNTVLAIAASLLAAMLTHRLIENPIRYGRPARAKNKWQIGLALFSMVILNSQLLRWNTYTQDQLTASKGDIYTQAAADMPIIYQHGCDDYYRSDVLKPCVYGNKDAPNTAILFGDSIGAQWFPTLNNIFNSAEWKIIVLTKSACPIVDEPYFLKPIGREYTECTTWRTRAIAWLQQQKADYLFIGGSAARDFTPQQWTEGTRRILDKLLPYTNAIYLIESNPTLTFNGPACLQRQASEKCRGAPANDQYKKVASYLQQAIGLEPKAHWLETASYVCPTDLCQAARRIEDKEVVVFRDSYHLTASFVATAAQHFQQQIKKYSPSPDKILQ
ncbi:acyltransferase family protein [Ottowia sp. VDI28]|uniref:acyltransferase family protein n=1 Tax=Ottowia sp. VDI28 TaxID=3133968 RepID=UPI003C2AE0F4